MKNLAMALKNREIGPGDREIGGGFGCPLVAKRAGTRELGNCDTGCKTICK